MTQTEALCLALDWFKCYQDKSMSRNNAEELADEAITAIKAALEAKDEPVAWISPTELLVMRGNALGGAKDWRVNVGLKPEDCDVGLYTTPPQRKPLTDEEIERLWPMRPTDDVINFARAIEAAHGIKEKNT